MKIELIIVLALILTAFIFVFMLAYVLYRYAYGHPLKKRPDAHYIPDSKLYRTYRDKMLKVVDDMERTPYEEVSICSFDGCWLYGRWYDIKKDAPLVIFFHGYHGVADWDGYGFFKLCKKNGINILMPDQRVHGKSEGSAITFGIRERYDCKLWTEYAAKRFGKSTDIFLAGVSMGAASVMMASELGLPEHVRAIIADCGYSEPSSIIMDTIKAMKLPEKPVYHLLRLGARLFGHFDLEAATALQAVQKSNIPILFIHGKQDSIVPPSMVEALYEGCKSKKERVLIEGADHANSAMTDYETYEKAVLRFMAQSLEEEK